MDGADFEHAVFQQLRHAQALRAGIGKVDFAGDSLLEQVEMLRQADARHDHVQVMQLFRIRLRQHACQKIGLFLVVAFQHDTVARSDEFFQHGGKIIARQYFSGNAQTVYPPFFFLPPDVPFPRRDASLQHGMSPFV